MGGADLESFKARIEGIKARADLAAIVRRRVPKLRAVGREFAACCPFHDEATPSFRVVPEKGFYHCFGCGLHGDAIEFVKLFDGVDFKEAINRIAAESGVSGDRTRGGMAAHRQAGGKQAQPDNFVSSTCAGQTVWNEAHPAGCTLAETYLRSRGIDTDASAVLDAIRFMPRCPTALWRKGENWRDHRHHAPAMLLPICRVTGGPGERELVQIGVEVVFLAGDGKAKAGWDPITRRDGTVIKRPSRKMWGSLQGGGVPIPPAGWPDWRDPSWIDASCVNGGGALVVAEGFESTLSLMARVRGAAGGFATLSLDNMQGRARTVALVDGQVGRGVRRDCLPMHNLRADPARPVFVIQGVDRVIVGIDADMKGLRGRWVQERPRGRAEQRDLTGAERSLICASLAQSQWRLAGARTVEVRRPQMGRDFNDYDQEAA